MEKNFKTLEVGRRYRNRKGEVVKIVHNDGHGIFSFDDESERCYMASGEYSSEKGCPEDLIKLLPEEPTTRLAELEAKRAELDKEIDQVKSDLIAPKAHLEHVVVDLPDGEMRVYTLAFTRVNNEWQPAFEIVPK